MQKVGFVGLGIMGAAMAGNLLEAGLNSWSTTAPGPRRNSLPNTGRGSPILRGR